MRDYLLKNYLQCDCSNNNCKKYIPAVFNKGYLF